MKTARELEKNTTGKPFPTMKGLVYGGPGKIELKEIPIPNLDKPTDAVVKITSTTICGTDLGILHGKVPAVEPGTILGHEGVGVIQKLGSAVKQFKIGDRVLISCITSDGTCAYCKKQMYSHCEDGGWILGHLINGTQAEYVRIPHADNSLYHIPNGVSEDDLVMLSDILPTGFEIGVVNGNVKPGDTVAIIGAGPIGMSALLTAQFYSPSRIYMIDPDENRLEMSLRLGATDIIDPSREDVVKRIQNATRDGVDVAIEAVGLPSTFDICQNIIRPGGYIANVGVHGKSVELKLQDLWIKNVTIRTGLVNTNTTEMLLKTVVADKLKPRDLITHRLALTDILKAYDIFENASREKAMKIILKA